MNQVRLGVALALGNVANYAAIKPRPAPHEDGKPIEEGERNE